MKTVYIIRHGQAISNVEELVQGLDDLLTNEGHEQAQFLAERFTTLPCDVIISSDTRRAIQTSEYIAQVTGKNIETTPLVRERARPSRFFGVHKSDPDFVEYMKLERPGMHDPSWRFEDAETVMDVIARAEQTLEMLRNRPEDNIVLVTHGMFFKLLTYKVLIPKNNDNWFQVYKHLRTENSGISIFELPGDGEWRVHVWNDQSHLGD
jgi:broad specificity phosphatase PhoE